MRQPDKQENPKQLCPGVISTGYHMSYMLRPLLTVREPSVCQGQQV